MAFSVSPHQIRGVIHATSSLSNTSLQPYSTPGQFPTTVNHETLYMGQTEAPLLSPGIGNVTHRDGDMNKLVSPSRAIPDLPSWTPLRALRDDEVSDSEPEEDELAKREDADLPVKQLVGPSKSINDQSADVEVPVTAIWTPKSRSPVVPSKRKRARFDGVFITKPPSYRRPDRTQIARNGCAPAASNALAFNLVDALARTFHANKHPENRVQHQRPRRDDKASTGPQTDVETIVAEDDQPQFNSRLARSTLKRQGGLSTRKIPANYANTSETNSEGAASLRQDIVHPERPVKRLKAISYEANTPLIDAALGTVQAPVSWNAEIDIIRRGEDFFTPAQTAHAISAAAQMAMDEPGVQTPSSARNPKNEWRMPTWAGLKQPVLSSYQSRGAQFRQRLNAIFGENATVRTDRVVRPRPVSPPLLHYPYEGDIQHERHTQVDLEFFAPFDEPDRESESTASARSASTTEEVVSGIPSTHITSQSPEIPPANAHMGPLSEGELNPVCSATNPFGEDQTDAWVVALQRLVKGKVRVKEVELETLSIMLAEIESVKDSLVKNASMTLKLRESVKQLSELHEIPFGDRNKLRQRAGCILLTWPSTGKEPLDHGVLARR